MSDLLIWVRAIHFLATISVAGTVIFATFIAEPALRTAKSASDVAALMRSRLTWVTSLSLLAVLISWIAWPFLLAKQISGLPTTAVLLEGPLWTVISQTDFGQVWVARLILTVLVAGALLVQAAMPRPHSRWIAVVVTLLAAGLAGALAAAGHAAANFDSDIDGTVQFLGDMFHLVAAAAWVGALIPHAMLLRAAWDDGNRQSLAIARAATARFSILGVVSVGTLLATGSFNSWVLAGSVHALTATDYGRLLLVKVALFFIMLSVAAVNRLRLTPSLLQEDGASAWAAACQLRRNAMIEATIGALILIIVAVLGTLPPGVDDN